MLRSISQSWKDKWGMIPCMRTLKQSPIEAKNSRAGVGGAAHERGRVRDGGYKASVMQNVYVLELFCTTSRLELTMWSLHSWKFKRVELMLCSCYKSGWGGVMEGHKGLSRLAVLVVAWFPAHPNSPN